MDAVYAEQTAAAAPDSLNKCSFSLNVAHCMLKNCNMSQERKLWFKEEKATFLPLK